VQGGALGAQGGAVRRAIVYGTGPLLALAATVGIDSGERQSLSLAVNGIQHQFHVSDTAVGFLPFAMALVGVLGSPPFGHLADRLRRTLLLAGGILVWTLCMGLNAFAASYPMLFVSRLGVGATEANSPAAISLISDYWPPAVRAKKMGLYQAGALVGALIGLGLGGVVVGLGGWRWAFLMWIPFGLAVAVLVARQPEPERGSQDGAWEPADAVGVAGASVAGLAPLPPPTRTGSCDYATATSRQVLRELRAAHSMWFGVMAITISQLLLNGLQFWAVPYFERVDHLGAPAAGAFAATLGLGAVVGILGGGFLADRLLTRGVVNARVFVVAGGGVAGTAVLLPAFASTHLWVTAPLLVLGGAVLTLPVAPAEALMTDVVVAELRGRAAAIRSIVRSLSSVGALVVGALSSTLIATAGMSRADGLRWAIVALTPVYAVGGIVMLLAARSYPADVAFVAAEARRREAGTG
jgi:MFS family permease